MVVDDLSKVEVVSPILRNKESGRWLVSTAGQDRVIGVFHVGTFRSRNSQGRCTAAAIADRMGWRLSRYWDFGNSSLNELQLSDVCSKYVGVSRASGQTEVVLQNWIKNPIAGLLK